ncbi:MAG: hypothetical protein DKT66_08915 [Candidatus Melainabacteria bacterium]|jgi:hypothetical protein|nr:MAG: hypothetical protein DKT66_08915 [Candidatus Melainabacteria bacterium]
MISIRSISFDTTDWIQLEATETCVTWHNQRREVLFLHYFPIRPDIPCSLNDVATLRDSYRRGVNQSGGGLVSVNVVRVQGLLGTRTIFKFPQQPSGIAYVASLTFPFRDFSFVIKLQCPENEPTGTREAVVLEQLLKTGEISIGPEGNPIGWSRDPYEPNLVAGTQMTLAEEIKYDEHFPEHPLSRARGFLTRVVNSINFTPEVLSSPAFPN